MRIPEQIVELDARTTDKPICYVFAVVIAEFVLGLFNEKLLQ